MIATKKLKQIKCSICFKEKYQYYPMQSILKSFNFFFFPFSFIQLLITNYQRQNRTITTNNNANNNIQRSQVIDINSTLISPCKCPKAIHPQCLINQCLFLLSFQCAECNCFYSIDLKPKRVQVILSILMLSLTIIILLVVGFVFIFHLILPKRFLFWNYIIGLLLLSLAIGLSCIVISNQNRHTLIYNAALAPHLNDNNSSNSCKSNNRHHSHSANKEDYYDAMKDFCMDNYQMDYFELIEQKVNFSNSLRMFKENDINEYIKQHNAAYNKLIESYKEEDNHDDRLKKMFGDHQIIKSSLVMSPPQSFMSDTKKNRSNLSQQDSSLNNKIKALSRSPLLIIKEAKEINEDFSPVHGVECKKKITMNFLVGNSDSKQPFQMSNEKQKDELITLSSNQ